MNRNNLESSIENTEIRIDIPKISLFNRVLKRGFDIIASLIGLIITLPIILVCASLVRIIYRESGFFKQRRIGLNGKEFNILKIKSMSSKVEYSTDVTTSKDPRITKLGVFYRKTKIDELPQLINVLKGDMSFVGPRPDVKSLIDTLDEYNKKVYLSVRPGITGPASIKYKSEEEILADKDNPEEYNELFIFPDKVSINKVYISEYTLAKDIKYIINTLIS